MKAGAAPIEYEDIVPGETELDRDFGSLSLIVGNEGDVQLEVETQ
jgi:hypothetical protein